MIRAARLAIRLAILIVMAGGPASAAGPQDRVTVPHGFGPAGAVRPYSTLLHATDSNLYGTTVAGGSTGSGTIFRITPSGTLTVLHTFNGADGRSTYAGLLPGTDGRLYGATGFGGASNKGTTFRITTGGAFETLHHFTASEAEGPLGSLVQASDGNFYGTTQTGGSSNLGGVSNAGTIFRITAGGAFVMRHSFGNADGAHPIAGLVRGSGGRFFGTTFHGGPSGTGVVFDFTVMPGPAGDYDGDGRTDLGLFRSSTGTWYLLTSSSGYTAYLTASWGLATDVAVLKRP